MIKPLKESKFIYNILINTSTEFELIGAKVK